MAPAKVPEGQIPVFIFFDENMPSIKDKTFSGLMNSQQFKINTIPLPNYFRGKKYPDHKVVLWMRRAVLQGWYQIRGSFSGEQKPIFLFCTTDLNFIEDAWSEMAAIESYKEKSFGVYYFLKSYTIGFEREDEEIHIQVCRVYQKNGRRKHVLINQIIQQVRDILISSRFS